MTRLPHRLAATLAAAGRGPRALFGLAGLAALAAFAWPLDGAPAPGPRIAPLPPPLPPSTDEAALTRPLFDPERRDWTARGSRAAVTAADPPRPVLVLRGLLLDGAAARALIDDGGGDPVWLARGEGRGGWHVAEIAADRVSVAQNERLYTAEFMGRPATLRPVGARPVPEAGAAAPALRR